jgi:hypothetical protein
VVASVVGPSVTSSSTDFSFQNLVFFWNLFEFFSEEIIQYSRTFAPQVQTSWNQAHAAPLLIKSFPKTPRTQSEASQFGGSHNYKTNYLPS